MAYAIGSAVNGGILYSDGTVKLPASSATNPNAANYRPVNASPVNTPTPMAISSGSVLGANTSSSGGGSNSNLNPHINPATGAWDDNYFSGQQQDINKLIDEAYGSSQNYLNDAENNLRSDYPTVLKDITGQYNLGVNQAGSARTNALGAISTQQELATQKNQDVMSDARRLYDELRRGYQQRFGGASSAGQAATELGNLEQQRQQGKIGRDYTNTVNQIEGQRVQVQQKYDESLQQLEQTKNVAVNEANRDFQNKLLQISQSRAENEQAKAQARLSALQDLRNKVFQINLQNMQFQQTLQAQKAAADQQLSQYASTLTQSVSDTTNTVGGFNPTVSSNLQSTTTGAYPQTNPYFGAISSAQNPEDKYGLNSALA